MLGGIKLTCNGLVVIVWALYGSSEFCPLGLNDPLKNQI